MRFTFGVLALVLFGCGSTGSGGSVGNAAGAANGGSGGSGSGGAGVVAGSGGSAADLDLPMECRAKPASVTAPGTNPWLEFIPIWVETICTNIGPCCDASTFDANGCRTHYSNLLSGLANGDPSHYAYDAAAAEVCLAEVRSQLGACSVPFGGSCTRVQRGLLRDGQACENARDCVSGSCADTGDGKACGGRPHAAADAPCALSCSLDSYGAWSCWGQPSQRDIGQCFAEDGLFCSLKGKALGPLDGSGATCQPLRASGDTCASATECRDGFCTAGKCGPDPGGDVTAACPCKANLNCVDGSCQVGAGFGEACEFPSAPCEAGLACSAGTCQCGGYYGSYAMPIVCSYD